MRTKNIFITLLFSLFSIVLVAQVTAKQKMGDKLYESYSYSKAIEKYLSIKDKDINVQRNLAKSYYNLANYKDSEKWMQGIMNTTTYLPEDVYFYAYILKMNQKYPESQNWMNTYYDLNPKDSRAIAAKNSQNKFNDLRKDKRQYNIKNLKMNGGEQEFGPSFYKEDIVFASSRSNSEALKRSWTGNDFSFLNLYKGTSDDDQELDNVKQFYPKVNQKWHEGPVTFNEEGTYMAYTRNNYKGTSKDKVKKLMLFTSEFKNDKWTEGEGMTFNSPEYSVGQASLSPDGKTMYFASDMPGGFGDIDIYKTTRDGGAWSAPVNLGSEVNTEGREMFPFINHDGSTLFFASDGHYGLGGLDLFMSSVSEENFGSPKNMNYPLNTSYDDFGMILDKESKLGYFSSNRVGGRGSDDIYAFEMLKPLCIPVKGKTLDKSTLLAVAGVTVSLYDKDGNVLETVESNAEGFYELCIQEKGVYAITGVKDDYSETTNSININNDSKETESDLLMSPASEFILYTYITDAQTLGVLKDVKCTIANCDGTEEEVYFSSIDGDFSKQINSKLNDEVCFTVLYEKAGYETKGVSYDFILDHPGQYNVNEQLVRDAGNPVVGTVIGNQIAGNTNSGTSSNREIGSFNNGLGSGNNRGGNGAIIEEGDIVIKPIYFDIDRYDIRSDARIELDKIVKLMTQDPNLRIELSSHTDCRASKKYNQILSTNRARASFNYVRDRISNPDRIFGEGYGESRLVNSCVCEPDNYSPCSETQHQQNRRTEFVIISQ